MLMALLVLALVLLLAGGAAKLPALGRGLGEGTRAFRKAFRQEEPPAKASDAVVVAVRPNPPRHGEGDDEEAVAPEADSGNTPTQEQERR